MNKYNPVEEPARVVQCSSLPIDFAAKEVMISGKRVPLTPKEADLLVLLAKNQSVTLRKDEISDALYQDEDQVPNIKIIDVFICKIRRKLNNVESDMGNVIETIQGRGYRFICIESNQS